MFQPWIFLQTNRIWNLYESYDKWLNIFNLSLLELKCIRWYFHAHKIYFDYIWRVLSNTLKYFFHLLSYLSLFLSLCLLSLSFLPTDQVAVVCHQDNVYFNYCDVDAQRCNLMIELWKTTWYLQPRPTKWHKQIRGN